MTRKKYLLGSSTVVFAAVIAVACFNLTSSDGISTELGAPGVAAENFLDGSLTKAITTEDCTLSNGKEATCYRIEVTGSPVNAKLGLSARSPQVRQRMILESG